MSNSGNRYISIDFTGTLIHDPELRTLPNGKAVCEFGIENEEWERHQYVLLHGITGERIICKWTEAIQRLKNGEAATLDEITFERIVCKAHDQTAQKIIKSHHCKGGYKIRVTGYLWHIEEKKATSFSTIKLDQLIVCVDEIELYRPAKIQQIANARGISTLCHFTPKESLSSILHCGLLSRHFLETLPQSKRPPFTDPDRHDGYREAICLSIGFPNYQMLFQKTGHDKQYQWVILLIDTKVLWELDCAFCYQNASSNFVRRIPLKDIKKPSALKRMFRDQDYDNKGSYQRQLQIPKDYPTHPQAEVLVFDSIPATYIKTVLFYNATALKKWREDNPRPCPQKFFAKNQYFKYRWNYAAWP